jgi:nucleoside-diphosphate-sugar epimerase
VDDLVSATLSLLECPAPPGGRVVEVGAEERIPIGELAGRLTALAGRGAPVVHGAAGARREDRPRRAANLAALRRQVAFRPRWSLDAILRQAVGRA